jgi:uncharacterized protein YjbJ (UPF0337 family)
MFTDTERNVSCMDEGDDLELTREELLGRLAGKAKEAAGTLIGNDALAREGREQQAQIDEHAETAVDSKETPDEDGPAGS